MSRFFVVLLFAISSLLELPDDVRVAAATHQSDVAALQQILWAWKETPSLPQNWDMNGPMDPCGIQWIGVSCSAQSSITSLHLDNFGIVGHLPSALGDLVHLQYLNLSGNPQLRGSIPQEMGHLTNLVKIDLSHCNLSGTIPLHLHTLTSLELMDLSQNSLSGRVPDFLVSLPKLTHLNLSYNQFDATVSTTQMHSSAKLLLASQEADAPSPAQPMQRSKTIWKIVIPVTTFLVISGLIGCVCALCQKWKDTLLNNPHSRPLFASTELFNAHQPPSSVLLYEDLKVATRNFHRKNKIGDGVFGAMYKGVLHDGMEVAIKQLSSKVRQDNQEFVKEVQLIASVQHPNIVRLLGCSLTSSTRYLVYEYVDNKSLAQALFEPVKGLKLEWTSRFNIALGTAQGLAHLHSKSESCMVHSDIKATHILLDEKLGPKIADFGLAQLLQNDAEKLHTFVDGTRGYVAPEYVLQGQLTPKADVFSYGIVLLELVTGRRNMDPKLQKQQQYLLSWVWELHEENQALELIDPEVKHTCDKKQAILLMRVALLCTQDAPNLRPTMSRIIGMLTRETPVTEVPMKPSILAIHTFNDRCSRATSTASLLPQEQI